MRREPLFEKISLLPEHIQIVLYAGAALIFGFFLWTAYRVRKRVGSERWAAMPRRSRIFYLWPLMTETERVLYVLVVFAFIGWGYLIFSAVEMVTP